MLKRIPAVNKRPSTRPESTRSTSPELSQRTTTQPETQTQAFHTPLTEWPTDILLELLSHLEEQALLDLAKTCQYLNTLCIPLDFRLAGIKLSPEGHIHVDSDFASSPFRALRLAFAWAPLITRLSVCTAPTFEQFASDLADVGLAIKRILNLRSFKLNLGGLQGTIWRYGIDGWLDDEQSLAGVPQHFGPASLVKLYSNLLDVVEGVGCTTVELYGGDRFCAALLAEKTREYVERTQDQLGMCTSGIVYSRRGTSLTSTT